MGDDRDGFNSWWPAHDASVRAERVALATGVSVRALTAGPEEGPPVVLVHGWGIHAYLWRRTIPALVEAGHRVVALDLPGHGLSDRPRTRNAYTLPAFTAHLDAFFSAMHITRAPVIAQSMGGRIAIELARTRPERVSALVLMGSVGIGSAPGIVALARYVPVPRRALSVVRVQRWMLALSKGFAYGRRSKVVAEDINEYSRNTSHPEFVAAMRQVLIEFDWRPLSDDALAQLNVPVLVLFGTRDRIVRPHRAAARTALMPRGTLAWVGDAGHLVNEEAPAEVNPMLVQFIGRHD